MDSSRMLLDSSWVGTAESRKSREDQAPQTVAKESKRRDRLRTGIIGTRPRRTCYLDVPSHRQTRKGLEYKP